MQGSILENDQKLQVQQTNINFLEDRMKRFTWERQHPHECNSQTIFFTTKYVVNRRLPLIFQTNHAFLAKNRLSNAACQNPSLFDSSKYDNNAFRCRAKY